MIHYKGVRIVVLQKHKTNNLIQKVEKRKKKGLK